MTFLGFHHVLIDATLGHIPYLSGSLRGGRFVQTILIEDMSHCYDIFGLHHVSIECHTRAYTSNFAFTIFNSDVQTSSSTYKAFRLRLHMDQMFRLHMHHICSSQHIKHSDFVFYISGMQTSPSYGSNVQTSSASHVLAPQLRRSDFVFCR